MDQPILISPSLLSADFADLRRDLRMVEDGGADLHHVDVMDGSFVPNITLGPFIVEAIRRAASIPLDVHLMIDRPAQYAAEFIAAGAARLTYHVESDQGVPETAELIREAGASPGVSIRPKTPLAAIADHLSLVDMILVMSVEPGFPGQSFMPEVLEKVKSLRREYGFSGDIEMDGGIDEDTIGRCAEAGANVFVAGSAIYGRPDPAGRVGLLREKAEGARGADA